MPRRSIGGPYPDDWKALARAVKDEVGWQCIRCQHPHEPTSGHTLTVHHLDMDPSNRAWWNLLALCQRCHLRIQARVVLERPWVFEHSDWFKPYAAAWYAHRYLGEAVTRDEAMARLDDLLALEPRAVLGGVA